MSDPLAALEKALREAWLLDYTAGGKSMAHARSRAPDVLAALALDGYSVTALAAPQPEPSAGLREAAEWLVRDALTYFPHADSVKAVQHALAAAPSPALSVERLARAFDLNDVNWPKRWGDNDFAWLARQVATEYDRLTAEDAP